MSNRATIFMPFGLLDVAKKTAVNSMSALITLPPDLESTSMWEPRMEIAMSSRSRRHVIDWAAHGKRFLHGTGKLFREDVHVR